MKTQSVALSFIVFVFISYSLPTIVNAQGIRKWIDIPYAELSEAQRLDIYIPDKENIEFPLILYIHGGAFMSGDKSKKLNSKLEGLQRGYALVSMNYRLSGESKFPAQIHDVKAAIRWLRANAKKYNINGSKIAVWGGSAGGYLAALAGTSGDIKELEDLELGNPEQSSRVQAVVDWCGPINFLQIDNQFIESGKGEATENSEDSPTSRLMGKKIADIPDKTKVANPETYISTDDPPFLIQHGTDDSYVPFQQSRNFAAKLQSVLGKEKVTINLFEGAGHGGSSFDSKENLDLVYGFLKKHLKRE